MTNDILLETLREKARLEQKLSLEVIDLIRLVDERRLYLRLGFSSLFDFVTKDLGYESSSAMRRIQAARLIREIPEVRERIESKTLSLSVVAQAQSFFRKEGQVSGAKVPISRKLDVLQLLENKSAREAEKELVSLSPLTIQTKERWREISAEWTEFMVLLDKETCAKLEDLRAHLSHQNPDLSYQGLFTILIEKTHGKIKKEKGLGPRPSDAAAQQPAPVVELVGESKRGKTNAISSAHSPANSSVMQRVNKRAISSAERKAIPAAIKRTVWRRDQGYCQYRDPVTRKKCESKCFLEIDHVHRRRHGGSNVPENLRLLCRSHNMERG